MSGAVVMGLNCVVMTVSVMNGHLFDFIVAMVVMVWVRCANLFWMGVVVSSLCHNVVLFRSGDSEVKRLMLFILVMIGVIFMSMCVLRSHVVVCWVLIMVRVSLIWVTFVVQVGPWIVTFSNNVAYDMLSAVMTTSVGVGDDLVMDWGSVMSNWRGMVYYSGFMMHNWSLVMHNWSGMMNNWGFVMNYCGFVVDWGSNNMVRCLVLRKNRCMMLNRGCMMD